MRPIDADRLNAVLENIKEHTATDKAVMADTLSVFLDYAMEIVGNQPTITQQPNAPLTLEELQEMGLLEWLWIEVIHPSERQRFRSITSAYYQIYTDYTDGEALCCGWPGVIHEFEYEDYDKTWRAYRRKPEEGAT